MSLVRIGPFLAETDETHTFSPRAIFPAGTAALHLVAPVADPDDLCAVTFSGDVDCVRVEGAPCVDHAGQQFWTGVTGEPPQFIVTSRDCAPSSRHIPKCMQQDIARLSSRHLFMHCADLVGQTAMPASAHHPVHPHGGAHPFNIFPYASGQPTQHHDNVNHEQTQAAKGGNHMNQGASEEKHGAKPELDAESRRVMGADVLKPAAVRLAADTIRFDGKRTRQHYVGQQFATALTFPAVTDPRPYLDTQGTASTEKTEGAPDTLYEIKQGLADLSETWDKQPWTQGVKRNLTPTEECFFGALERSLKTAAGIEGHFPTNEEMAVDEAVAWANGSPTPVTIAPVRASAVDCACDKALRRRGAHYALFVGRESGVQIAERKRRLRIAAAAAAAGRRSRKGDDPRSTASTAGVVNGFHEFLREGGRTAAEAGRAWAALSRSEKESYRTRAAHHNGAKLQGC